MAHAIPNSPEAPLAGRAEAELVAELESLRAEYEAIRERERMYRLSAELSGRLAFIADTEGNMIAMSRTFLKLSGIENEETLIQDWIRAVHPDEREQVRQTWARRFAEGEPFQIHFRCSLVDQSDAMILTRVTPHRDEQGRILRWYGSAENVTEEWKKEQARQEAVERLRASEEFHRSTLELSGQVAWTVEPDGTGLALSPRFEELTGLVAADANDAILTVHPDDQDMVISSWKASLEREEPWDEEIRLRLRDGNYRYFRVRSLPLRDEQGKVRRWYGITEDMHDAKLASEERREIDTRFRLAVQATNDAVWDYDVVAGTVDWSDNSGAFVGSEAPPGVTSIDWWMDRLHPEDRAAAVASLDRAIHGGLARWAESYRFRRDDGQYLEVLDRGFTIRDENGRTVRMVGAITDLTERNRAAAEIRRMQSELIHVSRLSAMGAMASTLAHELNQPLTAVSNFISGARRIATRAPLDGDSLREALAAAEAGAQRAGEIVRRLRDLVSDGSVSTRPEHLPTVIEQASVLAFLDEEARGIRHEVTVDPAAEWVKADRIQIEQVLINIVRNAVEAMEESDEKIVSIVAARIDDDMVEIRVMDTGTGIRVSPLEEVFSQFMTTKSEGMGIGLPICRTIVEAHGGTIAAENRAEGGALFTFTLPAAQPAERQNRRKGRK